MTPGAMPVSSPSRSRSARGGGVRVERQQDHRARALRVRGIDAGRRADEAVPRARDHERRPRAHDLGRLAQDHLDLPRIALVPGELDGPRRRLDLVEANDATLDLRDRLLGHDDDVAVPRARRRARRHRPAAGRDRLPPRARECPAGRSPAPRARPDLCVDSTQRPRGSVDAGDAEAGVRLVALVHVHDHGRHALERPRARERPGVDRACPR